MTATRPGLVSVLMPVRNEERSVAAAIESVLAQTHSDLELLVIDGRSDDATTDVVRALIAAGAPVRLLDNPQRHIAAGLNVGLAHARGEFVARIDAHASVNDEYLALAVHHLRALPEVVAVGGRRVGVATTEAGRSNALALSSPFGVGNSINHYGSQTQRTDHASFGVYRTAGARQVGGWDEELIVNEDVDFDFRLQSDGHGILYEPDMVIAWHVRETVRDLGRQYRRYGRGKAGMVRKNGIRAVRVRHLMAPALVTALTLGGVSALTGHRRVAAALTAPYGAAVAAASAVTWSRARRRGLAEGASSVTLPASFAAMHLGWGLGFVEGLVGMTPAAASQRETR